MILWIMIEDIFNWNLRCRAATLSRSKLPKFLSAATLIRGLYSSDVRSLGKSLPSGGRVEFLSVTSFKCFTRKSREISWIRKFHTLSRQPKHIWDISWYLMPWSEVPRALVKRWCGSRCCFWSVESVKWFGTSWLEWNWLNIARYGSIIETRSLDSYHVVLCWRLECLESSTTLKVWMHPCSSWSARSCWEMAKYLSKGVLATCNTMPQGFCQQSKMRWSLSEQSCCLMGWTFTCPEKWINRITSSVYIKHWKI